MCQIWHQHRVTWKPVESSHMDGWLCPCICAIEATQGPHYVFDWPLRSFKIGFHAVPMTDVQTLLCQIFINLKKWSSTLSNENFQKFDNWGINMQNTSCVLCAFVIVTQWFFNFQQFWQISIFFSHFFS